MTGNLARKWALLSIVAFSLVACGGQSESKAPSKEEGPPRTIEEAQDQIDAARAAIEQTFAEAPPATVSAEKSDGGAAVFDAATCGHQCKALASMKRAVDVVCKMTGDAESRCVNAKRRFDASTARVSAAGCKCPTS
jgi:hypothetical protein